MKIGDAVEKITKAFGVEPCDECKRRKEAWNAWGDRLLQSLKGMAIDETNGPVRLDGDDGGSKPPSE